MPTLEALGTAVPGEPVPQSVLRGKAADILGTLAPELLRHLEVFDNAGIATRHFARPIDWYLETRGWAETQAVYAEVGLDLLERATRQALDEAGLTVDAIDGIVFISTTGISTPNLETRLANRMGFRPDVTRVPVWGLGCAGGVAGLNLAARLAVADPEKRYLVLSLELCSLAFHLNDMSVRAFVATTLFADGAAAAIVRGDALTGPSLARIHEGASHQWQDSEDVMGWSVEDDGLFVVFSRKIPEILTARLAPVVETYLKTHAGSASRTGSRNAITSQGASGRTGGGGRDGGVDRYVFHPGGTKVLAAYEDALGLASDALDTSRSVLREYGNMSSPTVLFTLQESLRRAPLAPGERALLAAVGPGFAAELGLLEGPP